MEDMNMLEATASCTDEEIRECLDDPNARIARRPKGTYVLYGLKWPGYIVSVPLGWWLIAPADRVPYALPASMIKEIRSC